jgi:hypothetical protein
LRKGALKATDALTQSFAELRQLLRTENEQGDSCNYQQMHRLKQSFQHKGLLSFSFGVEERAEGYRDFIRSDNPRPRGLNFSQHPENEKKSPSGFGRVGVNGWNGNDFDVSKPAAAAAFASTNGNRAATA